MKRFKIFPFIVFFLSFVPIFAGKIALAKPPSIDDVFIVSGKKGSVPDDRGKIVNYQDKVALYAVIKSGKDFYLGYREGDFPEEVKIKGKIFSLENSTLKRWDKRWGEPDFKWYLVMPLMAPSRPRGEYKWYSNVFGGEEGEEGWWRGWQIIEYTQHPVPDKGWYIKAPEEAGTFRFRVEVSFNGRKISSPGRPSSTHPSHLSAEDYDKGIKDTVHRISRLSNHPNRLIRYIEALNKVPWLWGAEYRDPVKKDPSSHQSDFYNPVGIECSSILISSLRALGNEELEYTTTRNLAMGRYTEPVTTGIFTLAKRDLFEGWVPEGVRWSSNGGFYLWDRGKIQVRDKNFNLIREIKLKDAGFDLIHIALSENEKLYAVTEKDLESKVVMVGQDGKIKELFTPQTERTVSFGDTVYTFKIKITPDALEVKDKNFYLLDFDRVYIFNVEGKKLEEIMLERISEKEYFPSSFSLENGFFFILTGEKKVDVYNLEGKLVNNISLPTPALGVDIRGEKIASLEPFPLKVKLYNLDGSFFFDFTDIFLNQEGRQVTLRVDSGKDSLQIGDLLITVEPTYHLLLLYSDNGNGFLDSRDEVICAGHEGIEIRKVSYFKGRKFVLRRLKPEIKR